METIDLSSTVTLLRNGSLVISDRKTAVLHFTILITGGSGTGKYVPRLSLAGGTNESGGRIRAYGSYARVNWPAWMQAGDPSSAAGLSGPPRLQCGDGSRDPRCASVEFTYDVPQHVHLVAETNAIIDVTGVPAEHLEPLYNVPVSSSLQFSGIEVIEFGEVASPTGSPPIITVQITIHPEPATLAATPDENPS